ncbi:MAG TPA: DNA translocase FtsK, partial [Fredinandcohnia sp.]|nr:DNA translocase FtsK [Fredinandcohnia sp.]
LSGGIALELLFPSLQPFGARPGGAVGGVLADLLVAAFSTVGSLILVLAIMASSLIVASGMRLSRVFLGIGRGLRWLGTWVVEFVALQIAQHRLEREARRLEEEERRAELGLPPAPEKKVRFRRKKAEEGTLEAGLDGRVEIPEEEPNPPPAPVVELPAAARTAAREPPPARPVSPEPAAEDPAAIPPDPPWVPAEPAPREAPEPEAPAIVAEPEPAPPAPAPAPEPPAPEKEAPAPVIELPRAAAKAKRSDSPFDLIVSENGFSLPPLALLDVPREEDARPLDEAQLHATAQRLRQKLEDFGIRGQVERIRPGPVVTMYEFAPAPGVKISRIQGLADDLAMALEALRVRIVAPIPGRGVVGIEVPNAKRETVYLRDVLEHDAFRKSRSKLTLGIGKDIEGMPYVADLAKMPHLLIAGTTGSGKSVAVNAMIVSLLYKATPEEVRFIMVDPKMLELSIYEGIPHLLLPVVTDPRKAALALRWAVDEMERRYALLAENGVRDLAGYNRLVRERQKSAAPSTEAVGETRKVLVIDVEKGETVEEEAVVEAQAPAEDAPKPLPYLVIIIDELADLMMVASKEVETYIARIAQKARAAGIHLMVATQRPSVDVVTGLIKANFPSRISFLLRSRTDSMTILDSNGAEKLLGMGDMLILPPSSHHLQRVHGALVTETEIKRIVDHLKAQGAPVYDESILKEPEEEGDGAVDEDDLSDELYDQAVAIVSEMKRVSISMLQRKMRIGYNRSARMIERMEREGIVGPADGAKPREVLINAPPKP